MEPRSTSRKHRRCWGGNCNCLHGAPRGRLPPEEVETLPLPGAPLHVENSTIIGQVHTVIMELASNTIFFARLKAFDAWPAPVLATRLQQGCVRFSYVPPGAQVPRPYHCQPTNIDEAARVRPVFTSLHYGDAGYGQLSQHCAVEIKQGADDKRKRARFMISTSHSEKPTCAHAWKNICASVWRQASFTRASQHIMENKHGRGFQPQYFYPTKTL